MKKDNIIFTIFFLGIIISIISFFSCIRCIGRKEIIKEKKPLIV